MPVASDLMDEVLTLESLQDIDGDLEGRKAVLSMTATFLYVIIMWCMLNVRIRLLLLLTIKTVVNSSLECGMPFT